MSSDAEIFASTAPNSQVVIEAVTTEIVVSGVPGVQGPRGIQGLQGPQGSQGDPGLSAYDLWLEEGNVGTLSEFYAAMAQSVGGYPVAISNPLERDVLAFSAGTWINRPETQITDGGNF